LHSAKRKILSVYRANAHRFHGARLLFFEEHGILPHGKKKYTPRLDGARIFSAQKG